MAKIKHTTTPVPVPTVQHDTLGIPYVSQQQDKWCWAACTQMVAEFFHGAAVTQADIANRAFGRTDCGTPQGAAATNKGLPLLNAQPSVQSVLAQWKIRADHEPAPIPFMDVQLEIGQKAPVEVAYRWSSGNGHVAIVIGWAVLSGDQKLRVNDPWYAGIGLTSYTSVLTGYGQGRWSDTFRLKKVV